MSSGSQLALETPGQIFDPQRTPSYLVYDLPRNVAAINPILDPEPLADSLQLSTLPS